MLEKQSFRDPGQYIGAILRSNDYLEQKSKNARRAFGGAALKFVEARESQSSHLDLDTHAVHVIGRIDGFMSGQRALDAIREQEELAGRKSLRSAKEPHLRKVIQYNHAIRDLIDSNPQLAPDDILRFVGKAQFLLTGKDDSEFVSARTREVLTGMKQEIAAEQALWAMGVEDIEPASEDQELRGIDLTGSYNGQPIAIDVKASEAGEQRALNHSRSRFDPIPLWTGIRIGEFGNRFRATDEQVSQIVARFESVLGSIGNEPSQTIAN